MEVLHAGVRRMAERLGLARATLQGQHVWQDVASCTAQPGRQRMTAQTQTSLRSIRLMLKAISIHAGWSGHLTSLCVPRVLCVHDA